MSFRVRSLVLLLALALAAALQADTLHNKGAQSDSKAPSKTAAPLTTLTFKVPPDFLTCETTPVSSPAALGDPFAEKPAPADTSDPFRPDSAALSPPVPQGPPPPRPVSARQVLEAQGLTFPEGAAASFNPVTGMLTITNTPENLEIAGLYVESIEKQQPANVAFTLTVIEGPGPVIREANETATQAVDATPALLALLEKAKTAGSQVRVVADAFIEGKSGTRITTEAGREHSLVTGFDLDAKSRASIAREMQHIGLRLEIEPTIGADRTTIATEFNVMLNTAPPLQRQIGVHDPVTGNAAEFPVTDISDAQFISGIVITTGHTKLLGVTKAAGTPQENEDVLRAVFLTATLRRVEALPAPRPQVAAPASVPKGLMFAALPAPRGLFTPFLAWPKGITLQSWLSQAGITFPPGSSIEHRGDVLHLINTTENISLIAAVVDHEMNVYAKTVAFTLHTLEAPAALLRDLARQTLASTDDAAMLAAVEAAVARGEARFIDSVFLETKSGTRATHHAVREHRYLDKFGTDAQGSPDLSFETRQVGSLLEVEPTIAPDSRTVELALSRELHPMPPMARRDHFRDPASQKPFDLPVTDFQVHRTTTSLSVTKGSTKLLSVAAPAASAPADVLWATFLKCDVVPHVPVSQSTNDEPPPEARPPADPKAWHTRSFRVPPDFLSIGGDGPRKTAKMILESQGIEFPEGASVIYSRHTTQMIVRNTNENLDLVEAFLDTMCISPPKNIAFTAHVVEGPGPLMRRLAARAAIQSNHRSELDELLAAVKAGTARHLNTSRIETKSGTRSTAEQGTRHRAFMGAAVDETGGLVFEQESRLTGFRLELEPTIGADGATVELSLSPEFHTAPPFDHREHVIDPQGRPLEFPLTDYHDVKVTTGLTMIDGTARLLSLCKPPGRPELEKEDILQAIFITCDILREWK